MLHAAVDAAVHQLVACYFFAAAVAARKEAAALALWDHAGRHSGGLLGLLLLCT